VVLIGNSNDDVPIDLILYSTLVMFHTHIMYQED
jgi:hypothetical protein